jgi:hypothetical protein
MSSGSDVREGGTKIANFVFKIRRVLDCLGDLVS